ncbi:Holliday junction resolvase RuvX [Candidatus Gracilibacteria bacterium]|nr:Holliday junction resolvase RuvX [Candidatus Gracilibacteria bacterium]
MLPAISIDYGTRKSGLAYSVETFAFAWKTVETKTLLDILPVFIQEKKAKTVVLGMPYNIDGTMSQHGRRVESFAKKLREKIEINIVFQDERLTSSEAEMAFDDVGIEGDIDAEAARLILESWIEEN